MDIKIPESMNIPETFGSIGSSEMWFTSIVVEAMKMLYEETMDTDLESAISTAKVYCDGDPSKEDQIAMLAIFLRKEKSGTLKPPPTLKAIYRLVVNQANSKSA